MEKLKGSIFCFCWVSVNLLSFFGIFFVLDNDFFFFGSWTHVFLSDFFMLKLFIPTYDLENVLFENLILLSGGLTCSRLSLYGCDS